MARIVVIAKKKPRLETDAARITIGTRTSCDLTLRDPVAAERHAEITQSGAAFLIADLGSATGTYVGGLAITGPTALTPGDEIVIGVTKLVVALEVAEGGGMSLQLDLEEDKFFQKARMSGGEWIPGDREAMKEAEIEFSAFPALRVAGWSAVLVGVLLALVITVPGVRAALVKPGPLHGTHADIEDCATCHEGAGGVRDDKCLACHDNVMVARHPFPVGLENRADLAMVTGDHNCSRCHVEHLGGEVGERGGFVPELDEWRDAMGCERCHVGGDPTLPQAKARLARSPGATGGAGQGSAGAAVGIAPGDFFDHAVHAGAAAIGCATCHEPLDAQVDGRDYPPVSFAACVDCHTNGAGAATALTIPDAHGAQACQWCHADPEGGALRGVEVVARTFRTSAGEPVSLADDRPSLYFSFESHGHVDQAEARGRTCEECHHREIRPVARTLRPFWHALHLEPGVLDGRLGADEVRARCAACHAALIGTGTLAGSDLPFETGTCATCHASKDNGGGVPALSRDMTTRTTSRVDFPHALHANIDGGCLACHTFDVGDSYRALPGTSPEVQDCSACHADHANLTSCSQCHSPDESIFSKDAPPRRAYGSFSHFEEGHDADDCVRCHDNAVDATRVSLMKLPESGGDACIACHFETRYHWR